MSRSARAISASICIALVSGSSPARAVAETVASARAHSDSAAAAAVVMAFERAIATGDSAAALRLLAPDVLILEAGGVESRADYAAHHLAEDIAFRKAVPAVSGPIRVVVSGDVAWASSTSISRGMFEGRNINSAGAELMVLSRNGRAGADGRGWQIRAIHWSSRRLTK